MSVLALTAASGGATGYWHASYMLAIYHPTLTVCLFSGLSLAAYVLSKSLSHEYERLAIIVARTALRFRRRTRRDSDAVDSLAVQAPSDGARHDARHYLEMLPEAQRTTLVMRHMMDYSIDEIAEATGVPANTVKDRLVRALGRLREIVRRTGEAT